MRVSGVGVRGWGWAALMFNVSLFIFLFINSLVVCLVSLGNALLCPPLFINRRVYKQFSFPPFS